MNSPDVWTLIVEREPEFSDNDRNRLLGLAFYQGTVGPCGYSHEFVTNDPDIAGMPHDITCVFCAGLDRFERVRHDREEKQGKDKPPSAPRASDGRQTVMRILTQEEAAEARLKQTKEAQNGSSPRTRRR